MEPQISVTFGCSEPYQAALLVTLYKVLCGENAGREAVKEMFCEDCYARLKAEVDAEYPGFLAGALGEAGNAIQGEGQTD